jgi:endonuclease/exonuclease/phosphatase family metal-dependent hydrolase
MFRTIVSIAFFSILLSACQPAPTSVNQLSPDGFRKGIVTPKDYTSVNGKSLKVLSWNVEHFIDTHDNPYTQNRRENTSYKMEGRVSLLVQALRKADADIVVLQEFEHIQFLQQIAKDSLPKMGYQFFADNESPGWYMNVVVMSKVPLGIMYGYGSVTTPVKYVDEKTGEEKYETQSRINTRLWSVDVLVNDDYSFLLTGVHLKAGRGPRNVAMRLSQLEFLQGQHERFLKENPNRNILMVGDFNATPDSEEIQYLLGDASQAKFVNNLTDSIFSHPADAPKWRIDHILPNTNMQFELIENSLQVKYYFDKETQRKLADHLPLVAEFVTKEMD